VTGGAASQCVWLQQEASEIVKLPVGLLEGETGALPNGNLRSNLKRKDTPRPLPCEKAIRKSVQAKKIAFKTF